MLIRRSTFRRSSFADERRTIPVECERRTTTWICTIRGLMRDVVILGAGELGGTLAHILARSEIASIVRLVDDAGQVAAGKALDIMQAAPVEGFATRVSGHADVASPPAGHVIVLADRARGGEWQGDEALLTLKGLRRVAERSVVIAAGASQRDVVERGVRELGYARAQLIGTAPEALAGALRAIVAVEIDGSPRDVALTVLGVPPDQIVVPWDAATIGGFAATSVLAEPTRRKIDSRLGPLWPPGPIALATAASKAIQSVLGGSRQSISAFVAPDDSRGRRFKTAALPVRLASVGVTLVENVALSVHDCVALENAMTL
jgi:malate dehydrogenase